MVAKILVKIDICKGLSSKISVQSKDGDFVQILDYVGVPFQCHHCHTYGHLMEKCPLPFRARKPLFEEGLEASKEVGAAAAVGVRNNEPVEDREMDSIPVVQVVSSEPPFTSVPCKVDNGMKEPRGFYEVSLKTGVTLVSPS